jgi:hypothetical protein
MKKVVQTDKHKHHRTEQKKSGNLLSIENVGSEGRFWMGRQRKGKSRAKMLFMWLTSGKYKLERVAEKGGRRNG